MYHAPMKRIVPGAKTAVLMIHGVNATPRFFDAFTAVTPQDVSVHNLLLPGHGAGVLDFARTEKDAWRRHVEQAMMELCETHEQVFLLGHSLGAALAIRCAEKVGGRVKGMLLIAPPLRIRVRLRGLVKNICMGAGLVGDSEKLRRYYGTEIDLRAWRYLGWIPRYVELLRECREARRVFPQMTIPARVFLSPRDEMVSMRTRSETEKCPAAAFSLLPDSGHYEFSTEDEATLLSAYRELCGFE